MKLFLSHDQAIRTSCPSPVAGIVEKEFPLPVIGGRFIYRPADRDASVYEVHRPGAPDVYTGITPVRHD